MVGTTHPCPIRILVKNPLPGTPTNTSPIQTGVTGVDPTIHPFYTEKVWGQGHPEWGVRATVTVYGQSGGRDRRPRRRVERWFRITVEYGRVQSQRPDRRERRDVTIDDVGYEMS